MNAATPVAQEHSFGGERPGNLTARDLSFAYSSERVLDGVSLELEPGRLIGVIGPNGAGKSTLVGLLSGLLTPCSGGVTCGGRPLSAWKRRDLARRLAVVPQSPNLPESFTVGEIVLLGRTPYLGLLGNESARDRELAKQAMERTQTWHLAGRLTGTLSGGERQRVVVARALAQEPSILLLDEPTTHLDVNHQVALITLVKRLVIEDGLAALAILHDLNLASLYCDELVLLAHGRIQARGRPHEVLTQERIAGAYGTDVVVLSHPRTGRPVVVPEAGV